MRRFVVGLGCLFALYVLPPAFADEIRDSLFTSADTALKKANQSDASLLAPGQYTKASELYKRAETRYQKGKGIDQIKADLLEATTYFNNAAKASDLASTAFTTTLRARADALSAKANHFAPAVWFNASKTFDAAARKLEANRNEAAEKTAKEAEALFREAELIAIKANYLTETRNLIAAAQKNKVNKYAPATFARAKSLLAEAEQALSDNRYDIDQPRILAREAKYEANHAIYIASKVIPLVEGDIEPEQLILAMEEPVVQIAGALDQVVELDGKTEDPIKPLLIEISDLRLKSYALEESTQQVAQLETDIHYLEERLGIQNERLARQEQRRAQLAKLEDLFSDEEAIILTKGSAIIVRLVGLSFAPGKATIDSSYFELLAKLQKALTAFEAAELVVEGHTDSFGSDEANQLLSHQRAESVRTYLLANSPTRLPGTISAIGFGESQPIGNNETAAGRQRNRRIDLVIKPQ